MKNYHNIISGILGFPTTRVSVAALKEDEDVILGYTVYSLAYIKPVLHWVHVKQAWRRMGIARLIVPPDIDAATHMTAMGKKIKPESIKFNPFLI